ncbi:MAG: NHLP family bacteriocin export ABC transporter peptidase/permease/ATPase subunit [Gemmatimonadetes bacterium]|nr:NHLP family bacteriocin export ABC transporter peptidase/permease/ATPase subunit [Gemmatimonadota bacterium]MYG85535.1 NHLP family bacteriocin export ABC transporter peptidase/permease/ATPase subunit [Gemmatimonadota bacterium]MYJ89825.1 NHLP family bacteriocin export ABC transporter peptidase/permease/ATPase subunit [Gemmatimonadota bacterium]
MTVSTTKRAGNKNAADDSAKRISTPVLLQMHASECGAACLGIVLGHFGRWVPLTELREKCEVSRDGSSAASILRASRHYGLECNGLSVRAEQLKMLELPLVLFWQFSHFLVLEGIDSHYYYLNDPSTGRRRVSAEEFEKGYSGIALRFKRGEDFTPGGERPDLFRQLNGLIAGSWRLLTGVVACGLMLTLLTLVVPASLGVFVDDVMAKHGTWGGLVTALLGGGILVYVLSLLKHRFLKRLAVRVSIAGYSNGMSRLLRLPVEFFENRLAGDVTDRVSSTDRIAKNLADQFLVLVIDMAMSSVFLVAMFAFDAVLTLIVLVLALLHAVLARFLNNLRAVRSQSMRREQGLLIGLGMQMLSHADNLRMTGADDRFFSRWSGQQARELRARQLYSELGSVNASLPGLVDALRSAAILGIGGMMVMQGEMSLGMLVGFYILAEMFLAPVERFLEFAENRQALETDLQRLEDISKTDEDPVFRRRNPESDAIHTFNGRLQLAGQLELRNVTFGYNRSRPPLIKDFNLVIKPGQRIAVVGPSGSGKSTLARLVSGVYQPWSGEIMFDDHLRDQIPEEVLRQSISMVDQEIVLFSASLRDNITLWNPAIPDEVLFAATRDAQIHDEVLLRPQGYATLVEEGGSNFSGGQRQRLEIARALVGKPTVLILDEATSALDAATEEYVDDALRRRGVTCLIVAHRLSTVRDCDEIIVLDEGVTVQRGTHDELIADRDGVYYKLVRSN